MAWLRGGHDRRQWLLQRTSAGPARLRAQVMECWENTPGGSLAERLAEAGAGHWPECWRTRAIAMPLWICWRPTLITLALLARAENAPEELGSFAAALVRASAA
jgi:hypothetical protein